MSKEQRKIVLIDASPKVTEASVSDLLTSMVEDHMKGKLYGVKKINVRQSMKKNELTEDYEALLQADAIVFTFPLYIFCLPGILMQYLQDYYDYYQKHKPEAKKVKIYTVINCGFPEAFINEEASRVIKSFSEKVNGIFRFAIMIGGGGMLLGAKDAPFMAKSMQELNSAFSQIAEDIKDENLPNKTNLQIKMNCPDFLYYFMGGRGWISTARKNGLKKKDIYRKPYLD